MNDKTKNLLRRIFAWGVPLTACGFLVYTVLASVGELSFSKVALRYELIFGAILAEAINAASAFTVWYLLLRYQDRSSRLGESYLCYSLTSLSRYLPLGKVWQFVSVTHFTKGKERKVHAGVALFLSLIYGMLAGLILSIMGLPHIFPEASSVAPFVVLGSVVLVVVLLSRDIFLPVVFRLLKNRLAGLPIPKSIPISISLSCLVVIGVFGWFAEGVAAVWMIQLLQPEVSWSIIWYVLGAYAVASFAGYLVFFVPAGIGVREGIFAAALTVVVSPETAAFVALSMRVLTSLGDVIFCLPAGVSFAHRFLRRSRLATKESAFEV